MSITNVAVLSCPLSDLLRAVATVVMQVRQGQSLSAAIAQVPAPLRAGTQALSFTTMRHMGAATHVCKVLASRRPPPVIDALLVVAVALMWPQERQAYPPHTLVDQAVAAARALQPQSAAFVNAVLRRFLRESAALIADAQNALAGRYNHAEWWIAQLRADWPAQWEQLLLAANEHPPLTLRVNARHLSGSDYLQQLAAVGMAAQVLSGPQWGGQAVVLAQPCPVDQLPGFAQGAVSVQDASAQRAAPLLLGAGLPAGARVLDACAAPGGKAAHLLELANLSLWCLDRDASRLAKVEQTLSRLGLAAHLVAADARELATWWDGQPFDAILLDAPCTASGIVRRHPDIRWLRRAADLAALAREQAQLLDALWPLLKPGGRLLYATCSIFKREGVEQIDAFLQRHSGSSAWLDAAAPGHLLPLADNCQAGSPHPGPAVHDGFYYALIHKP